MGSFWRTWWALKLEKKKLKNKQVTLWFLGQVVRYKKLQIPCILRGRLSFWRGVSMSYAFLFPLWSLISWCYFGNSSILGIYPRGYKIEKPGLLIISLILKVVLAPDVQSFLFPMDFCCVFLTPNNWIKCVKLA